MAPRVSHSSLPPWHSALTLILIYALLHPFYTVASAVGGRAPSNPTATLGNGRVVGTAVTLPSSTVTVHQFLGVPFAKPPVRFSPPEKLESFKIFAATAKPPACIQQFNDPPEERAFKERIYNFPPPAAGESENCLYLNVYAPAPSTSAPEPKTVMVWFYGGNLQLGSNAIDMYDGTSFAANQDVVVVAANYRTNVFGFPNTHELPLEKRNLGFLDQRLALQWVAENIDSFNGDPNNVTIFGQSAGSASVDIHITSTVDKHNTPFRAGIMQSGQAALYLNHNNNNYAAWDALATALDCSGTDVIDCIRVQDALKIKSILETKKLRFMPVADGQTMVEYPLKERGAGKIAQVPIIVGLNADEGRYFTYFANDTLAWLKAFAPALGESFWKKVICKYPIDSPGIANSSQQLSRIVTDFVFQCPASAVAKASKSVGIPTWRYYFNVTFPNNEPFPNLGAFHAAEIPLVFGTYNTTNSTERQRNLSKTIQTAWAKFAKNPKEGPGWPPYPIIHVFGADGDKDIQAEDLDEKCELYAEIPEVDVLEAIDRLMNTKYPPPLVTQQEL